MYRMIRTNFASRLRSLWKNLFQSKESPREFLERQDLYKSIMAITFRNLRQETISTHISNTSSNKTKDLINIRHSHRSLYPTEYHQLHRNELEKLLEEVENKLDSDMEIHRMFIKGLRYGLQNLLIP